ncbi:uncharacterized protein C12orf56 homolog [Entelurus aequoreus]|uniref:uncharacterized protein C12orf56 homolog n=1 Tax=Entelurus aequoreus TaxID=161455 RepID=UPI002B1E5D13|nr:uncharacterized protein C12orf56 homolog [Entelurus aequoreus]
MTLLSRRNVKLDSFLQRTLEPDVYARVRAYEPCVVVSPARNKVYMHAVLSDERVYVAEYRPRTLASVVGFGSVRDIRLINDLPDFLRGNSSAQSQHIRITYVLHKTAAKDPHWLRRQGAGLQPASTPAQLKQSEADTELSKTPRRRQKLDQVVKKFGKVLSRLRTGDHVTTSSRWGEEEEAELHLYAISRTSKLYLHLHSCWNTFIIRSTLAFDELHRPSSDSLPPPTISWARTSHLYDDLSRELLRKGSSVESFYVLLQELKVAARHHVALRHIFWRCGEVCDFLVESLEECLHGRQNGLHTVDQLLLSTLIIQTLAIMFQETDTEAARLDALATKKGALASRMLLSLVCDPHNTSSTNLEFQDKRSDYLDAACWLLFEMMQMGHQANRCGGHFLSVSWTLQVLQDHPHMSSFLASQACQVVLVLSDLQESLLSPLQSVLLFQRCRLLLTFLQHSDQLAQQLRAHVTEEFRYFVNLSSAQEKLPPYYPITKTALQALQQLVAFVLHTPDA